MFNGLKFNGLEKTSWSSFLQRSSANDFCSKRIVLGPEDIPQSAYLKYTY